MAVPPNLAAQIKDAFKLVFPDSLAVHLPKDPTFEQHMTSITTQLKKIITAVDTGALPEDWSSQDLALRVSARLKQSSDTDARMKASKEALLAIITSLVNNLEALGDPDFQARLNSVLQKVKQDPSITGSGNPASKPPVKGGSTTTGGTGKAS